MAMTEFSYSYTHDQLNDILKLSMSLIVGDDLRNFSIRPMPSLHFILNERGFGHGAGFEIDAYPRDVNSPVAFYVIQGDIFGYSTNGMDVAVFTPAEICSGISEEILRQVKHDPKLEIAAGELRKMFAL